MRAGAQLPFARSLRHDMTEAERLLWRRLRSYRLADFRFRRQHPVGPYIADFACIEAKLIVEVDGSQHADSLRDERREEILKEFGFRVIRFWNNDVLQRMDQVLVDILRALALNSPLPPSGHLPPHAREGN
jgi:very-short-patch-repair endonuclease